MKYTFTGKNLNVFDDVKERIEKKLNRMQKLVPEDAEVFVSISKNRHLYKMEVSVPLHKRLLRAETTGPEVSDCTDAVADILEKQIKKYKSRLRERNRRKPASNEELSYMGDFAETGTPDEASDIVIHRTKRFAIKPMDAQDAVMEMELLGHSFFVFRSADTDEVNVVYKRNEGEYGLIEPSL